jgi:hypothetical protein
VHDAVLDAGGLGLVGERDRLGVALGGGLLGVDRLAGGEIGKSGSASASSRSVVYFATPCCSATSRSFSALRATR